MSEREKNKTLINITRIPHNTTHDKKQHFITQTPAVMFISC